MFLALLLQPRQHRCPAATNPAAAGCTRGNSAAGHQKSLPGLPYPWTRGSTPPPAAQNHPLTASYGFHRSHCKCMQPERHDLAAELDLPCRFICCFAFCTQVSACSELRMPCCCKESRTARRYAKRKPRSAPSATCSCSSFELPSILFPLPSFENMRRGMGTCLDSSRSSIQSKSRKAMNPSSPSCFPVFCNDTFSW